MSHFIYALEGKLEEGEKFPYVYLGISNSKNPYYSFLNFITELIRKNPKEFAKRYPMLDELYSNSKNAFVDKLEGVKFKKFNARYSTREQAEIALRSVQEKVGDRLIGSIINPTRKACEHCGMRIREDHYDSHIEKYCNAVLDNLKEIDELLDLEQFDNHELSLFEI